MTPSGPGTTRWSSTPPGKGRPACTSAPSARTCWCATGTDGLSPTASSTMTTTTMTTTTMTTTTKTTPTMTTTADVYAQVHAFYTRHYGLIDAGSVQDCAQTFTPDAIMSSRGRPERSRAAAGARQGRADIAEALARVTRRRAAEGIVRRHLVGPLTVT